MSSDNTFFSDQTEQSAVKAHIVSSYFEMWARVISKWNCDMMAYVDLFCGPGQYGDGHKSTPIQIIEKALQNSTLVQKMRFVFNDASEENIDNLKKHVAEVDPESKLHIAYLSQAIDNDTELIVPQGVPILSFVDPFGYKGLTLNLINALLQNNGSDCIFFFNYNRINMALSSNTKFDEHLESLFGLERTNRLKSKLGKLSPSQREPVVLQELQNVLTENKANYVLPFKFYSTDTLRTSHFIIFVTKHPIACKLMKQVMYANSAKDSDGIATFSFEDSRRFNPEYEQLSMMETPFVQLQHIIVERHKGETLQVSAICNAFDNDFSNFYVGKNVKEALKQLELVGKIQVIAGRKIMRSKGKLNMPDGATVHIL